MGKLTGKLEFAAAWSFREALKNGGAETKLSMVLMGLGNIVHKQVAKGLIYMAIEAAFTASPCWEVSAPWGSRWSGTR